MFVVIGTVVLFVTVFGGYLLEHGKMEVMIQPVEFMIIYGAALGSFLIASPSYVINSTLKSLPKLVSFKSRNKQEFLEYLALLFELFTKIRKEGIISVEADIDAPAESPVFTKHKVEHELLTFLTDNLRMIISSNIPPMELESLMEAEIETHHEEAMLPAHAIAKVADAMPGLGLVAAVLGVVLTMGKIDQPPMVIGHSIGVALIGTFLGIFTCYGFLAPLAAYLERQVSDEAVFLHVTKNALVASVRGLSPMLAVEFGRRVIPGDAKPQFSEMESMLKK